MQDILAVLNGGQVVVCHNQSVQAGKHSPKLADLGPVLEAVIGDVKQAQGGAGHNGGTHATVLIMAQEQLLQPAGQDRREGWRVTAVLLLGITEQRDLHYTTLHLHSLSFQ